MNRHKLFKNHIQKDTSSKQPLKSTSTDSQPIPKIYQSFCKVFLESNPDNMPNFQAPVNLRNFVQSYSANPSYLKHTIRSKPCIFVPKDCYSLWLNISANISYNQFSKSVKTLTYSLKQLKTLTICLYGSELPKKHIIILKKLLLAKLRYIQNIKIVSEHNAIASEAYSLLFNFLKANNRQLKHVDLSLSGNHLTALQITPLLQVFRKTQSINRLRLKLINNNLSDEFIGLLMDSLLCLSALREFNLDISLNPITEKGLGTLARQFEELRVKLKRGILNLKRLECDNIAYLRKLFGQYEEIENIDIMY